MHDYEATRLRDARIVAQHLLNCAKKFSQCGGARSIRTLPGYNGDWIPSLALAFVVSARLRRPVPRELANQRE